MGCSKGIYVRGSIRCILAADHLVGLNIANTAAAAEISS